MPGGVAFDRVADQYDATRGLPPGVVEEVARRLARRIGAGRTIEVGVGTGRWARPLQQLGIEITGVDLSLPMLQVARQKGFVRAIRADAARLPFADSEFDGAMSNHLLHLVYDVPGTLRELARVAPGRLRSVLEHETARPDVVEAYLQAVRRNGFDQPAPGLGEKKLAESLRPDALSDAARFQSRGPALAKLDAVARRAFRDTWGTPTALHDRTVRALRERFEGQDELTEVRVEIAEWSSDRLLQFADDYARTHPVGGTHGGPADSRARRRHSSREVAPK